MLFITALTLAPVRLLRKQAGRFRFEPFIHLHEVTVHFPAGLSFHMSLPLADAKKQTGAYAIAVRSGNESNTRELQYPFQKKRASCTSFTREEFLRSSHMLFFMTAALPAANQSLQDD